LRQFAQQARQTEITDELLDLVTGAEALADQNPRKDHTRRT
jgi:F0F1-type ATP synthase gamma subunit